MGRTNGRTQRRPPRRYSWRVERVILFARTSRILQRLLSCGKERRRAIVSASIASLAGPYVWIVTNCASIIAVTGRVAIAGSRLNKAATEIRLKVTEIETAGSERARERERDR